MRLSCVQASAVLICGWRPSRQIGNHILWDLIARLACMSQFALGVCRLEDQLADQMRDFLSNTGKGLMLQQHVDGSAELVLSPIFLWFAQDFTRNGTFTPKPGSRIADTALP